MILKVYKYIRCLLVLLGFFVCIIVILKIYFVISPSYLNFKYIYHCDFDSKSYTTQIGELKNLYYPTWILIQNEKDLMDNDLGINLSHIDLSDINFDDNNVIISLGAKIKRIKYCKNNLNKLRLNRARWVDIYGKQTDDDDVYIYKIDKVSVAKNELMRPSGILDSLF